MVLIESPVNSGCNYNDPQVALRKREDIIIAAPVV